MECAEDDDVGAQRSIQCLASSNRSRYHCIVDRMGVVVVLAEQELGTVGVLGFCVQ